MPSLIERADGRFELRESVWTQKGPRSRTLAIFRELTDEVIDHAISRATTRIDRGEVSELASRAGLHVKRILGSSEASELIARARVDGLWPTLVSAVGRALADEPAEQLPDHLEGVVDWMGVSHRERGEALVDLLRLADRIERSRSGRRRGALSYPSLAACV